MTNQEKSEKVINVIVGSLAHLIKSQVDFKNHAFMGELQNVVGCLFFQASACLKNDLKWDEYPEFLENEATKPAPWRDFLDKIELDGSQRLH